MLRILFIGDIVARPGRQAVAKVLPDLRKKKKIDLVIANAENLVHGRGVTPDKLAEMQTAGVDGFTSGDHVFWRREVLSEFDELPVTRPANYPPDIPGTGFKEFDLGKKGKVLVINVLGLGLMGSPTAGPASCPFRAVDAILEDHPAEQYSAILVDVHAETTAEKAALAWYLDGRVSLVVGTHTHVPTADARLLPQGTAFVTDAGMVGAYHSVLGVQKDIIIQFLKYPYPERFEWEEEGPVIFNSVLVEIGTNGQAKSIERVDSIME